MAVNLAFFGSKSHSVTYYVDDDRNMSQPDFNWLPSDLFLPTVFPSIFLNLCLRDLKRLCDENDPHFLYFKPVFSLFPHLESDYAAFNHDFDPLIWEKLSESATLTPIPCNFLKH